MPKWVVKVEMCTEKINLDQPGELEAAWWGTKFQRRRGHFSIQQPSVKALLYGAYITWEALGSGEGL